MRKEGGREGGREGRLTCVAIFGQAFDDVVNAIVQFRAIARVKRGELDVMADAL